MEFQHIKASCSLICRTCSRRILTMKVREIIHCCVTRNVQMFFVCTRLYELRFRRVRTLAADITCGNERSALEFHLDSRTVLMRQRDLGQLIGTGCTSERNVQVLSRSSLDVRCHRASGCTSRYCIKSSILSIFRTISFKIDHDTGTLNTGRVLHIEHLLGEFARFVIIYEIIVHIQGVGRCWIPISYHWHNTHTIGVGSTKTANGNVKTIPSIQCKRGFINGCSIEFSSPKSNFRNGTGHCIIRNKDVNMQLVIISERSPEIIQNPQDSFIRISTSSHAILLHRMSCINVERGICSIGPSSSLISASDFLPILCTIN